VKEGLYLVRVLALGLTFSAFVLSFFSMVWIIMKKIEGKILFVFLGLVFISEGLLSYVLSSSIQKIFYLQGIRGMIILIMVLVSAILGRRRKYLFDVKK
jgi:hypothetical protein